MADYKVLGTDHNAYTVSDMDATVKLFCDVLGFEFVIDEDADADLVKQLVGLDTKVRTVYLKGPDGHQIELVQYYGPEDKGVVDYRICDTAAAHMAIRVTNVPAAVEAAEKAGLKRYNEIITVDSELGRTQSCYMRDPDGLTIELLSRPN